MERREGWAYGATDRTSTERTAALDRGSDATTIAHDIDPSGTDGPSPAPTSVNPLRTYK